MLDTYEAPIEIKAESAEGMSGRDTSGQTTAGEATATPTVVPEPEPQGDTSVNGSCEEAEQAGESRVQGRLWWR